MKPRISIELQETVKKLENIKEIHFDAKGRHYFNVFSLIESEKNPKKSLYGDGEYSHSKVIEGLNIDNIKEDIAKGVPDTKIVITLSREEVLASFVDEKDETLISKIANMSEEEKEAMRKILGVSQAPAAPETPIESAAPKITLS